MAKSSKNAAELFTEDNGITVNPELFAENIEIIGVDEIPENEEIVDEVVITDEQNEEVSEEVVQAVANAIVEQAIEDDKTVKEIVDEICDENKGQYIPMEDDKDEIKVVFPTRGFKSLKDAKEWTKSPNFTNLGKADQAEFLDWLNKIK